jgi:hypothetical protein
MFSKIKTHPSLLASHKAPGVEIILHDELHV